MPSKFSSRLRRRVVLSGKDGIAGFYKGVGARVEGNHTSKGTRPPSPHSACPAHIRGRRMCSAVIAVRMVLRECDERGGCWA
ncbi:hypothetical protein EON67_11355 [archaeon]|nr:MAG: hypothetical protein EON67_11355 [archaeon]